MVKKTGRDRLWRLGALLAVTSCASVLSAAETAANRAEKAFAREILGATGVRGGLVVHLGCGDGKLTAALVASESFLVHGLDADAENVTDAREHIRSEGLYGRASVEQWAGDRLPYAENLVNLLVAEDLGKVGEDEVMRVLVPRGAAYTRKDGKWTKTVKRWPETMDQWSHFLHDASNNAVANDSQVGPPRRLKWVGGPLWSRSHEFNSSVCAMVSTGGRVFYILDEGLTGVTPPSLPEKWTLIARDAFNGVLLWKRPMAKWGSRAWKSRALRSIPPTVPRRIVAQQDRVFVTLGYDAPVSVLDAATGQLLTTFEETEGTEEIRCMEGVLIVRRGNSAITAVDGKTGKKRWEAAGKIQPLSFAAQGRKVFYQAGQTLFCLGVNDGKQVWQTPCQSPVSLLVVHDDRIVLLSGSKLLAKSAETGETLWTSDARVRRRELFVANDRVWHWEGDRIVGRDLNSGQVTTRLNTDEVFTPGHHHRCYQSKATERFIITPNRGVEFVSVTGAAHVQNDWVRGPCRYGVMPCNGLLYVPPNPCFCYPGVKLTGFYALAAQAKVESGKRKAGEPPRLQRGPAYEAVQNPRSEIRESPDWPTYRHDARRTGAAACRIQPQVLGQWKVCLQGPLTPPVVCGDRVYVAAKDAHTLHVLHVKDGRGLWQFTAAGRIDSPPTVCGELVLFGCTDGRVYCLRASDGQLVWRFTAAPSHQRIIAFGQLESPWRVHGSILLTGGVAYFTAGRSTYLDGGIRLFGIDPRTGAVLHETRLDTRARTREDANDKPFIPAYHMEGARSDVLVSEGDFIYLGQYKLDRSLVVQDVPYLLRDPRDKTGAMGLTELMDKPFVQNMGTQKRDEVVQRDWQLRNWPEMAKQHKQKYGGSNLGERKIGRHVFSTGGFLDDTWYNRTFWMYSETWPGFYIANRGAKTGQLLTVGSERTYAVQAYPSRNLQSPLFAPGAKGYLLFADENDNEPVLPDYTRGVPKGIGFTRKEPPSWFRWIPVRVRAMVAANNALFVAGPPDVVDPDDPMAAFEGRAGAVLWAVSKEDGKKLAEYKLDSPPVFDGLIAASGRLFLCTTDGHVICLGED